MGFTFINSPRFRAWRDELTKRLVWFVMIVGLPAVAYTYYTETELGWSFFV